MVKYLKINENSSIEFPFSLTTLKKENPNVSFPREMSDELLASYGVYPVTLTKKPAQTATQNPVEQTPQQINGVWTQVWAMVDVSPEEAARRAQEAADEADREAVKIDSFVRNFIAMTPDQVSAYVSSNTGNLSQVRALLNKMYLMLLVLARQQYR